MNKSSLLCIKDKGKNNKDQPASWYPKFTDKRSRSFREITNKNLLNRGVKGGLYQISIEEERKILQVHLGERASLTI